MSAWVNVNERLPEKDGVYLIYLPEYECSVKSCYYSKELNKWGTYDEEFGDPVMHVEEKDIAYWMEMPELPIVKGCINCIYWEKWNYKVEEGMDGLSMGYCHYPNSEGVSSGEIDCEDFKFKD